MYYSIAQLLKSSEQVGQEVTIKGWVRTRRDSKAGISFLNVHDGSCFAPIQVVIPQTLPNYQHDILQLSAGCSVVVTGKLSASPAEGQAQEIQAERVEVIGWVDEPETYPISPKHHTLEYLREVAHLRVRTNTIGAVTRVRHTAMMAIHQYLTQEGFCWVNTPIITASDCEGAGELFRVSTLDLCNLPKKSDGKIDFSQDFFGRESFLTVSGQLNLEAYCLAMSKVYTFGPTFRAENSNTSRHLAEFWMVEPEIAFADLKEDMLLAEKLLKFVFERVLNERSDDMDFFTQRVDKTCRERLEHMVNSDFVHLDYTEAVKHLESCGKTFTYPIAWGMDLQSEHERYLAEEYIGKPVIVMNYPKDIKAFYMRVNDDGRTVAAMDVLAPGIGEIIGGSQREDRLSVLDERMIEKGIHPESLSWYRDLRRYGSVPHAGFGLGFERLLSYMTGIANVRDVIPYPRVPGSAEF